MAPSWVTPNQSLPPPPPPPPEGGLPCRDLVTDGEPFDVSADGLDVTGPFRGQGVWEVDVEGLRHPSVEAARCRSRRGR